MDGIKLRKVINNALIHKGIPREQAVILTGVVASKIEMVLELEADEKELEVNYDDLVHLNPLADQPKRISDSLAPPPITKTGSVVPAQQLSPQVVEIKPTIAATEITLTTEETRHRVTLLMNELIHSAPETLEVIPDGSENPVILHRQIDTLPEAGMVRLSYRLGIEIISSPSSSPPTNKSLPSNSAPMAIDAVASTSFSVFDGIRLDNQVMETKLNEIKGLAGFIYRKNKTPIISRTPARQGPMSFDPRFAAHDDA